MRPKQLGHSRTSIENPAHQLSSRIVPPPAAGFPSGLFVIVRRKRFAARIFGVKKANSGWFVTYDAYRRVTFQVLGSRFQPGCDEDAVVKGFLDMIDEVRK